MGARVLIVDDEKLILWSMAQALEEAGHVVEQAENAAQAIAAVEREAPELLLLDHKLPDRTGTEILPELRKIAPNMPVIMITAHASVPGAVEALKGGVCDYIGKPFEISDLLQVVSRALESSRLRDVAAWHGGQALKALSGGSIVALSPAMKPMKSSVVGPNSAARSTVADSGGVPGLVLLVPKNTSMRSAAPCSS